MKHADALLIAQGLVERLAPACTRIEIAGSIRRGMSEVKDVEIVAIPDLTPLPPPRPMFGQPRPQWHKTALDKLVFEMCLEGWMRPEKSGEKYKKLIVDPEHFGIDLGFMRNKINLDLFLVTPPAEWGVQMVIRTGPADFSHWCVTRIKVGGGLPNHLIVEDGAVGDRVATDKGEARRGIIPMPEEIDFLNILGLGWIEPGEREARWRK
jgi:DNA polymerase/3'-5' exonuclease PolX